MRTRALFAFCCCFQATLPAQQTTAERTNYTKTSSHADVLGFLDSLARAGAGFRRATLAMSPRGREVPLVIASRPLIDDPADAHRSGKPVIYVQANIHGGQVEGKEAAQMLLRDLTIGPLRRLLDSVVLILVPIYNPDGNDALGPAERNRPGQNGPATVGLRPNGQGLDLNRDYVKQEAPETRGAAAIIAAWDPDLFVDLHTTNGSYHGYVLTYSPGLNPNSPPANDWTRDRFLPELRRRMRERQHREVFWYGNFRNQHPDSLARGWETYDPPSPVRHQLVRHAGTGLDSERGLQQRGFPDPGGGYLRLRARDSAAGRRGACCDSGPGRSRSTASRLPHPALRDGPARARGRDRRDHRTRGGRGRKLRPAPAHWCVPDDPHAGL